MKQGLRIINKLNSQAFYFYTSVFMILLIAFISLPFGTGDTAELVLSSQRMRECLNSGILFGCNDMERFGLSPHLISIVLLSIFNDINSAITAWALLNFLLFAYLIYKLHTDYADRKYFLIGTIVFSPLTAYAVYSYTEMSFIVLSFILLMNIKNERYWLSGFLGIFLSGYKESAILIILPLTLAVIFSNKHKLILKDYLLIASQIMGFLYVYLFNYFKYLVFINSEYQTAGRVKELNLQLSNFLGIWLSPSGGIIGYFWISIILLLIINLKSIVKFDQYRKSFYLILFTIMINALLLTNWFAPYGWVTWGPRLFMPIVVLGLFSTIIVRGSTEISNNKLMHFMHLSFSYLSSVALIGFLINPDSFKNWLSNVIFKTDVCPKLFIWEIERESYINCFINMSWNLNSLTFLTIKNYLKFLYQITNSINIYTFPILIFTLSFILYFFKSITNYDNKK
jgi:hypothetical protein